MWTPWLDTFAHRRCLVPADAFYEWHAAAGGKQPYAIARQVHDRMPVILEPADWPAWLGDVEGDPAALLRPAADDVLRVWPVARAVDSPRNNGAELLAPVAEAP